MDKVSDGCYFDSDSRSNCIDINNKENLDSDNIQT